MKIRTACAVSFVFLLPFTSCMSAAEHARSLHSSDERDFTLGAVQKRIYRGMSQTEVAQALGAPNIVTKDEEGDESWIYDKISSEASYSQDKGGTLGAGALGGGSDVLVLGGLGGSYNRSAGASATTQKTLTVVIKFNRQGKVKDFNYHASTF